MLLPTNIKSAVSCIGLTLMTACATKGTSFQKSEVIERIGNKSETPEWATGEKTTLVEGVIAYSSARFPCLAMRVRRHV